MIRQFNWRTETVDEYLTNCKADRALDSAHSYVRRMVPLLVKDELRKIKRAKFEQDTAGVMAILKRHGHI